MQQRKENLTAQVDDTAAHQLALEEEAAGVKLALGNITSSLRQLAPAAGDPSPPRLNQTQTSGQTAEVSFGTRTTCRAQMLFEALLRCITDS